MLVAKILFQYRRVEDGAKTAARGILTPKFTTP